MLRTCAILLLVGSSAFATSMRLASFEELVVLADVIVVGRVTSRASSWDGSRIYTEYTIAIEDRWRGETLASITLRSLGGVVAGIGQQVAGSPHFVVGERALLFLEKGQDGRFYATGMSQGVFRITKDGALTRPGVDSPESAPTFPSTLADLQRRVFDVSR